MSSKTYKRKTTPLSSKIDNDTVLFDPEAGKYFGLNPVASRIWDLLENPITEDDIIQALLDQFDVSEPDCRQAVQDFLAGLDQKDLLITT